MDRIQPIHSLTAIWIRLRIYRINTKVRKGKTGLLGYSAGGRPIRSSTSSPHNMSARVNLILLQETMKFLSRTGGVESWQKIFKKR